MLHAHQQLSSQTSNRLATPKLSTALDHRCGHLIYSLRILKKSAFVHQNGQQYEN